MKPRHLACTLAVVACLLLSACGTAPPISIGQKESTVGQGIVINLTNTSDQHLHEVVVDIESPEGEAKQFVIPTLAPHESFNLGWLKLDGWPIPKGSTVKVSAKDFAMAVGPQTL